MKRSQTEEIIALIEECDFVDFAPFGEGASDSWVKKAEDRLGISLPPSYKWWLQNYGGGEVGLDQEIYSIYEMDFDSVNGGDVVFQALKNQRKNISPKDRLYIYERSHHTAYLNISKQKEDGECCVIEDLDGEITIHPDFLAFLTAFIRRERENA